MSLEKALFSLDIVRALLGEHFKWDLVAKVIQPIENELKNPEKCKLSKEELEKNFETTKSVIEKLGCQPYVVHNWIRCHGDDYEFKLHGRNRFWPEAAVKAVTEYVQKYSENKVRKSDCDTAGKSSKVAPITEEQETSMDLNDRQKKALEVVRNPELMQEAVENLAWKMSGEFLASKGIV